MFNFLLSVLAFGFSVAIVLYLQKRTVMDTDKWTADGWKWGVGVLGPDIWVPD